MGIETVVFGLAAIGGICLGITLIGLTICTWALIFMVMRKTFGSTRRPDKFELVEEEKPVTTRTRRNSTAEAAK